MALDIWGRATERAPQWHRATRWLCFGATPVFATLVAGGQRLGCMFNHHAAAHNMSVVDNVFPTLAYQALQSDTIHYTEGNVREA